MAKKAGGSLMALLVPVLVLTLVAAGGGTVVGMQLMAMLKARTAPKPVEAPKAAEPAAKFNGDTAIKDLAPIVTNLAGPGANWIRLQVAIVYDKKVLHEPDILAGKISNDIIAFLRTVSINQIQGPSGLQHLREDLDDRVAIRSDGTVRELVIEGLVLQ